MAFVNQPGRIYTDPYAWHADPVYRVTGSTGVGTLNHTIDVFSGVVEFVENYNADGFFTENFGGPYPGGSATACIWGKVIRGRTIDNRLWTGSCPFDDDGASTDFGAYRGSFFDTNTSGPSSGADSSSANVGIGGYLLLPWVIPMYDNPYMDDDALEDEYNAAISATSPGFPWNLEVETAYPVFETIDLAPDEKITGSLGDRTEGITYLYDPPSGRYAYYGETFNGVSLEQHWDTGLPPEGEQLFRYEGGVADWTPLPEAWMPTQDTSQKFSTEMVTPEDPFASAIPLTAVCDTVLTALYPGDNTSGGRENQTIVFRVGYRLPRFRWYREIDATPPRRILGRPHGGRVIGDPTVQGGGQVLGGIL